MLLLGIDPSLTATGLALVDVGHPRLRRLVAAMCVQTKPQPRGKRHLFAAEADGLRVDEIADALLWYLEAHQVDVVACEAPAGAQHANAAKALALAYATVRAVLRCHGFAPLMVQAHEAKRAATGIKGGGGKAGATKDQVVAAMARTWGECVWDPWGVTKVSREAIADALAVATYAMTAPGITAHQRTASLESIAARQQHGPGVVAP